MRGRLLLLALVLGVVGFLVARESGRAVAPQGEPPDPPLAENPSPLAPAVRPGVPGRDPFRFGPEEPALRESHATVPESSAAAPLALTPARVRLVGFVRRQGVLRAALVVDGTLALAAPGETVANFSVLSIDEEGVSVRDPEGREMALQLPEEP